MVPNSSLSSPKAAFALVLGLNLFCLGCGAGAILFIGEDGDWGSLLRYHAALLLMHRTLSHRTP